MAARTPTTWDAFKITSPEGAPSGIALRQLDRKRFWLDSDVTFVGADLGLAGLSSNDQNLLRTVGPTTLGPTDLASVPAPFRWWANTYGVHTPAALIHDRFIGEVFGGPPRPGHVSEQQIDRYFRFMLRASGVKFFRRWLIWAAVASRTRLASGGIRTLSMVIWLIAAVTCVSVLIWATVVGNSALFIAALLAPLFLAALWGAQWGAGVIISYVGVPFLLPPAVVALPLLLAFVFLENAAAEVFRSVGEEIRPTPLRSDGGPS